VLNRTTWRGKEPRSCGVIAVKGRSHAAGSHEPVVVDITIEYRPPGCITYLGNTKYDGWTAFLLDKAPDGTLLDGNGKPLAEGQLPVYRAVEVHGDMEFNDLDFGNFVGESEANGISHVSVDDVMDQVSKARSVHASIKTTFIAARRNRPLVKLVLSNSPSGVSADGFGTRIVNISNFTPRLHNAILDQLMDVVTGVFEGRYSIKNLATDSFIFLELSDVLVDCTPNERGQDSRFHCLHEYVPPNYLEDLAKRLQSTYEVDVTVVDGPTGGLLVRTAPGADQLGR